MKEFKRITAFVLTLLMLASCFAFASEATIVSPSANSVTSSDSLLISVKFTDVTEASITVYEQKIKEVVILTTGSAVKGTETTYAAVTYNKIDTTGYEEENLASVSAIKGVTDRLYMAAQTYVGKESVGFYTKQLTNVKPGVYKIEVKIKDANGKVVETQSSLVAVKEKVQEEADVFETKQASPIKIIQTILKSIFK